MAGLGLVLHGGSALLMSLSHSFIFPQVQDFILQEEERKNNSVGRVEQAAGEAGSSLKFAPKNLRSDEEEIKRFEIRAQKLTVLSFLLLWTGVAYIYLYKEIAKLHSRLHSRSLDRPGPPGRL